MRGQRIRWSNVAKLAGGVGVGAALLFALPALFSAPDPPPLEPDIGLAPSQPFTPEPGPTPEPAPPADTLTEERRPMPPSNRAAKRSGSKPDREANPEDDPSGNEPADPATQILSPSPLPTPIAGPVPPSTTPAPTVPGATPGPGPQRHPIPPVVREFGL